MDQSQSQKSTHHLSQEFFLIPRPVADEFRTRYESIFALAESQRKERTDQDAGALTVRVVTKACELFQEIVTLRVNNEIVSRRLSGSSASPNSEIAMHSFSLPDASLGFELDPPSVGRSIMHRWNVNYSTFLNRLNQDDLRTTLQNGLLPMMVERAVLDLWIDEAPIFSSSRSPHQTFSMRDLVMEPRWNTVRGDASRRYDAALQVVANTIVSDLRAVKLDSSLITRLETECLNDPRGYFDHKSLSELMQPKELRIFGQKIVMNHALNYYRSNVDGDLSGLIDSAENHHRSLSEAIILEIWSDPRTLPHRERVVRTEQHVFHRLASAALGSQRDSIVKSLDGFSFNRA